MACGHATDRPDVISRRPQWLASLRLPQRQPFLLGHELLECSDVEDGVRVIEYAPTEGAPQVPVGGVGARLRALSHGLLTSIRCPAASVVSVLGAGGK